MTEQLVVLDQVKATVIDLAIKFGPKLFVALVTMAVGVYVARWVARLSERLFVQVQIEVSVRKLLVRMCWSAVMVLFAILALQNLGVELLPLIAGLGIAGAGVALAMQGVLGNLAAGLTIIFTRPFRVGEFVSIAGVEGRVEEISLFDTTLGHPDRSRIVVPNRKIVGEILHNYGAFRQIRIGVRVAYGSDLKTVFAAVNEILASNPRVLKDPAALVAVAQLDDSAINVNVMPWVAVTDFVPTGGEINAALLEAFRERGIVIPFPQREVRILGGAA